MKKIFYLLLGGVTMFGFSTGTHAQTISTVAGSGVGGYSGNGGSAMTAQLYGPDGVALDAAGNLYIADQLNNCIRKVDKTTGVITTVAGNDTAGYSGNGGLATSARLNKPSGVAVDAAGNIFIADKNNQCIRKVNTVGIISTVAGIDTFGYNGDNRLATTARLAYPSGVAVDDSGNIYIADQSNNRIRKVNTAGIITTIAGNGYQSYNGDAWPSATLATLWAPTGVAIDKSGNVYIADNGNGRIRMVDTFNTISTVVKSIQQVTSVAADNYGNIYFNELGKNIIRKFSANGVKVKIAGNGLLGVTADSSIAISGGLGTPRGVAVDSAANVYFAEWGNNKVRRVSTTLAVSNVVNIQPELSVYPNPAENGSFTVNIASAGNEQVQIVITNILGEKVMETTATVNKPLNVQLKQASGIYFVTAVTANGKSTKQVAVLSAH